MLNFCTLLDSNYLANGFALYESLKIHCKDFHLYIFAFDDRCFKILDDMRLADATIISLDEFENQRLLDIKLTRTTGEYCWTCTSSTIQYVLEHYEVDMCTYLDADIYFYSSPQIIFEEMDMDSILLTEHRYLDVYKWLESNGKYCVQFITFKKDANGLKALRWWVDSCIEWCFARLENGKFGDQKYLDDWKDRFDGVHVLQNYGGGVAPWNIRYYNFTLGSNAELIGIEKATKRKFELIFYHFHGLKFLGDNKIQLTGAIFILDKVIKELIYKPYVEHLLSISKRLYDLGFVNKLIPVNSSAQEQTLLNKIWRKISELSVKGNRNQLLNPKFLIETIMLVAQMIKNRFNVYDLKKMLK